jgi:biopolymer transport protein ExbB
MNMRTRTLLWPTLLACAASCGRIGFDPGAGGDGGPPGIDSAVFDSAGPPPGLDTGVPPDPDALWWDPAWGYRVRVSFNDAVLEAQVGGFEELIDIPLPVRIDESGLDRVKLRQDAADVRFVAADNKTVLAYEMELRPSDEGGGSGTGALFWVKVPSVSKGGLQNHVWLYYGNPEAPDAQQPAEVWSSDYVAVWHLGESDGDRKDSAGEAHHLAGGGQLGAAQDGDLLLGDSVNLSPLDPAPLQHASFVAPGLTVVAFTVETFIHPDSDENDMMLAASSGPNQRTFELRRLASQQIEFLISLDCVDMIKAVSQDLAAAGRWHHIAATYDGDVMRIYHDGFLVAEQPVVVSSQYPVCNGQAPLVLGALDGQSMRFTGRADELRLSGRAQSPAWIKAQYLAARDSNSSATPLIVYGEHEARP